MGRYFLLVPAIYGELGDRTVLQQSAPKRRVERLHLILDGPIRDDFSKVIGCYLTSKHLSRLIEQQGLTGGEFADLEVEFNEQYRENYPETPTPDVRWLRVRGRAGDSDFGIDGDDRLVVSELALDLLRSCRLEECRIYDASAAPTRQQITADLWEEARQAVAKLKQDRGG